MRHLILALALLLAACGGPADQDGPPTLSLWYHTGKPEERAAMEVQVATFNAAQDEVRINLVLIPEADYNTQVQAAAVAGALPDLLDLDGPYLANYAWKGLLQPLDELIEPSLIDNLLPSLRAQGSWQGSLWGLGTFDSGLGLYVNRGLLSELLGDQAPTLPDQPEEAWDAASFEALLRQLSEAREGRPVLDLKLNYGGEWWTYAFSPVLQSAGADLIDREEYRRSIGLLDGDAAVAALGRIQTWITDGLVDANADDQAFVGGRVLFSWSGHWDYPRYREALGEDLALVPLPDFGTGSRTGMGSWAWAITANCTQPELAARFLEFLLRDEEILRMSDANGAVPATRSAAAASRLYGPDGELALFVHQLERSAVPRPVTPAYPAITDAFQQAMAQLRTGGDPAGALSAAARAIEQDIADHDGYPVR